MKVSKLMVAVVCCAMAGTAMGQSEKPKAPEMPKVKVPEGVKKEMQPATDKKGAPNADEAAWMAAGEPGEMHQWIAKGAGKWDAVVKTMMPGAPVSETKGSMSIEMFMGGRYSHTMFKGEMDMGGKKIPFEGAGTLGYDNTTQKFQSTWCDSMSTNTSFMTGTLDSAKKVLTMSGEMTDPMSKTTIKQREVTTRKSDNETLMEFYMTGPDGKEMKEMEITFTRIKSAEKDKSTTDKAKDEMEKLKKKAEDAMPKK